MASIYLFAREEGKDKEEHPVCGGCGDPYVTDTFVLADSKEAAQEQDGPGRCSDCIVDLLRDEDAEIDLDPDRMRYAVLNRDRSCFLGELGDFTETHTFGSTRAVAEFLLKQVHTHGNLKPGHLDHLQIVSIHAEDTVTERAKQAARQYGDRVNEEDTPNAELAAEAVAEVFPEPERNVEVTDQ